MTEMDKSQEHDRQSFFFFLSSSLSFFLELLPWSDEPVDEDEDELRE